ncbi:MAG: hypothetical protein ACKVOM_09195, partial [Ferruginibacter sp.]
MKIDFIDLSRFAIIIINRHLAFASNYNFWIYIGASQRYTFLWWLKSTPPTQKSANTYITRVCASVKVARTG